MIRYGLVGVATNFVIYVVYLLITYLGLEPKKAMTLVYVIGASIGFVGNRKWTFAYSGNIVRAAVGYVSAHILGYVLNFLILYIFVDRLDYAHQGVQAMAIIIVAGFLFVVFKYCIFREKYRLPENK